MPRADVQPEDAKELCAQAVFLQRSGNPESLSILTLPDRPVPLICDGRQVGQALTNVLKNAAEAIEGGEPTRASAAAGEITLACATRTGVVSIVVEDNGIGLPDEGRERLTEPYVTTREQGHRPGPRDREEDHGRPWRRSGLDDRQGGGARISLVFRRDAKEIASARPQRRPHNEPR